MAIEAVTAQNQADTLINDTTTALQTKDTDLQTNDSGVSMNGISKEGVQNLNENQDVLDGLYLDMQELNLRSEVSELFHKSSMTITRKISDAAL